MVPPAPCSSVKAERACPVRVVSVFLGLLYPSPGFQCESDEVAGMAYILGKNGTEFSILFSLRDANILRGRGTQNVLTQNKGHGQKLTDPESANVEIKQLHKSCEGGSILVIGPPQADECGLGIL
jgi:hypothetical protein